MSSNLRQIQDKIAKEFTANLDGGLAQYVKSSIQMLKSQGKDIDDYALVQIESPLQMKENEHRITQTWKIININEAERRPVFNE